ncbi:MAG: cell envelope integrity EipB family protein [Janthinobacterium lividum]
MVQSFMEFHRVNRFPIACLTALAAWASVATAAVADDAAPVPMAGHHAVYKLSLLSGKGTNAPASASGVIDFDFSGSSCEGYTSNLRQLVELQPAEGDSKLNDVRNNTFEDADAKQYTFTTKSATDSDSATEVTGKAERAADGKISVDLKAPPGHSSYGAEVLFPVQHMRHIIAAAEHGDKLLSADVYDGSDTGSKLFHTLTVIGAPLTSPPDDPSGKAEALKGMRRWPVVISYFGGDKDQPDYVLTSDLYENGISRGLKLDYGDFVLAGALDQLTVAAPSACKK